MIGENWDMNAYLYMLQNFFTHKAYLLPADQIPGTIGTPLHYVFESVAVFIIIFTVIYLNKHKHLLKKFFVASWINLLFLEVLIVTWESTAGPVKGIDWQNGLSLYPCSLFMYTMPFAIWGKGKYKTAACGYICTLGLLGALVNFLCPSHRLATYSCISFPAMHTFIYHGTMLLTCLTMLTTKYCTYKDITHAKDLFLPCVPSLLLSIPANILNYSPIDSDYMYFKGYFPAVNNLIGHWNVVGITLFIYALYIIVPMIFYLPGYLKNKASNKSETHDMLIITIVPRLIRQQLKNICHGKIKIKKRV